MENLEDNIRGIIVKNSISIKDSPFSDEPHIHEIDFEATITDLLHYLRARHEN